MRVEKINQPDSTELRREIDLQKIQDLNESPALIGVPQTGITYNSVAGGMSMTATGSVGSESIDYGTTMMGSHETRDVFQGMLGALPRRDTKPEVIVDPSSHQFFSGTLRLLAGQVIGKIHEVALHNNIKVSKVELFGFTDPEENMSELVVIQWVEVPARHAIPYWDKLMEYIYSWVEILDPQKRQLFENQLAIEVRWGN